jgi:hypothetical protein
MSSTMKKNMMMMPMPAFSPNEPGEHEGVFTGFVLPHGPQGEYGIMKAIYTSVS